MQTRASRRCSSSRRTKATSAKCPTKTRKANTRRSAASLCRSSRLPPRSLIVGVGNRQRNQREHEETADAIERLQRRQIVDDDFQGRQCRDAESRRSDHFLVEPESEAYEGAGIEQPERADREIAGQLARKRAPQLARAGGVGGGRKERTKECRRESARATSPENAPRAPGEPPMNTQIPAIHQSR